MNTEPLDPTKTDQSELIIDPEAITQWVDGTLPTPHRLSVDMLAEKFSSLNDYSEDIKEIQQLMQSSFTPEITAPAHTVCRVLKAINEQMENGMESQTDVSCCKQTDKENAPAAISGSKADAVAPASVKTHRPRSLDSLPFEIQFPQQHKKNRYILPAAAVLLLSLLVGAIVFSENYSERAKKLNSQSVAENVKVKKYLHDHKAATMTAPSKSPHSVPVAENVQLANDDEVRSPHDESEQTTEQKKKNEAKKEQEKKDSSISAPRK